MTRAFADHARRCLHKVLKEPTRRGVTAGEPTCHRHRDGRRRPAIRHRTSQGRLMTRPAQRAHPAPGLSAAVLPQNPVRGAVNLPVLACG
jgi:hypothetical protein